MHDGVMQKLYSEHAKYHNFHLQGLHMKKSYNGNIFVDFHSKHKERSHTLGARNNDKTINLSIQMLKT